MSDLGTAVDEYLAVRRALGFGLRDAGRRLRQFAAFAQGEGALFITTALALRWAQQSDLASSNACSVRLSALRLFARWRAAADPRTEVPPDGLLPYRYRRKSPYVYARADVGRLIAAARRLSSPRGLRARTFSTLIALHAVTGLRTSESLALDRGDVDLKRALLFVRRTKFGKSRWVPVHATTARALARYAHDRDRVHPRPQTPAFFLSEQGKRVLKRAMQQTFRKVTQDAGLLPRANGRQPRIHDFRHGFAIATVVRWYRAGADVEQHLPRLSTYLGHTDIRHTYWYLSATPELLHWAARRADAPARRRTSQ